MKSYKHEVSTDAYNKLQFNKTNAMRNLTNYVYLQENFLIKHCFANNS